MYAVLDGMVEVWRDCVRNIGASEVPSTRCALLVGSSRCAGHCWAAVDCGALGLAALCFVCCDRRPGMGKESLERPMLKRRSKGWPGGWSGWRGRVWAGRAIQQSQWWTLSRGGRTGNEAERRCHRGLRVYRQTLHSAALGLKGVGDARRLQEGQRSTLVEDMCCEEDRGCDAVQWCQWRERGVGTGSCFVSGSFLAPVPGASCSKNPAED